MTKMKSDFSYTQGGYEYGSWVHCPLPYQGIITEVPSSLIPKNAAANIVGCYIDNGEINPDIGYTKFPIPGNTKSNKVHGTFLRSDMFSKLDGSSWQIALTTTNIYRYNTSTTTWDCITKGTEVCDCEDAWTASANVTSTADTTIKIRGSKSAKHVIAAGFTTGIASTKAISDTDCTAATALHFWIYSTVALTAGQVKVGISETATLGGTPLYFDVPAIEASVWTACCVDGTFTGYDHVISVGLNIVSDVGEATIYLDDIRAVTRFTGDEDNRFSVTTMNDTFILTNGVDHPQKIVESSGTFTVSDLTTSLATGDISTAEIVISMMDHIIFFNTTENAADCPQRASWSNIGQIDVYAAGTAGYQDLVDDDTWIVAVLPLTRSSALIYKEDSIVLMEWVDGHTPFRFATLIKGYGALSKDSLVYYQGGHVVLDRNVLYKYSGDQITILDENIKDRLFGLIDMQYQNRIFTVYEETRRELQLWIPSGSEYPNDVWCLKENAFYRKSISMTGYGLFKEIAALTIGDLTGTIGEQNWRFGDTLTRSNVFTQIIGNTSGIFRFDETTTDNDGVAVERFFETGDFVLPDTQEYLNKTMRVNKFIFEGLGQTVDIYYSTDGGSSWRFIRTLTLTSSFTKHQLDFDVVTEKIRFKFTCYTSGAGFKFRYFGFYLIHRTTRG